MPPNDDTEMCRHFLFPRLLSEAHIFIGAMMVVMEAREFPYLGVTTQGNFK
jgi:hypothetical protein